MISRHSRLQESDWETAAITTRGLKENDMDTLAGFISEVVDNIKNEEVLTSVRKKVNELMEGKALFNY
ncbi:glycine/serine hydroxymethyltransferase [Chryseobacterium ginsenosidimutans]|nr:glycine/serine hydroxymethyltransferase [Chryseobacterium ginsenosidimutans]